MASKPTEHVLFISDLHLEQDAPELLTLFSKFMQSLTPATKALYILGDFFAAWIGQPPEPDSWLLQVEASIQTVSAWLPIFLLVGNRDFLLEASYLRKLGITLLAEPTVISCYGREYLITHGDELMDEPCYQLWRRCYRCCWLQRMFLAIPYAWRQSIAAKIRSLSKQRGRRRGYQDISPEAVAKALQRRGVTALIHGHTHLARLQEEANTLRITLGDWSTTQAYILHCDATGATLLDLLQLPSI
jgi:UDP-2,3-diacylglucosamine hydrolase